MSPIIITYLVLSAIFWTFNFLACTLMEAQRNQTSFIEALVVAAFAICGWYCLYLLS